MNMINKIFVRIERLLARRWYNPFATLWLNLRCLPFSQAVHLPISVYGRPKFFELGGSIKFDCPVKMGMIEINNTHPAAPSYQGCQSEFVIRGHILFHGRGQIDTGVKIYVNSDALLECGDKFKICDMVNVGCYGHIKIGNMSRVTHRCQIMDTNYHFIADMNQRVIPSTIKPIFIGDNVWVGNSSTITGGSKIPDRTIVASNSLVNKVLVIPPDSIVGGVPVKLVKTGFRKIESIPFTKKLYQYYNNTSEIYPLPSDIDEEIFLHE